MLNIVRRTTNSNKIVNGDDPKMSTFSSKLQSLCKDHGFDTFHCFDSSWYNELIEKEGHVQTGVLKKLPHSRHSFLLGNSNFIWPFFIQWLKGKCNVPSDSGGEDTINDVLQNDPFDTFCKEMIIKIINKFCTNNEDCRDVDFDLYLSNCQRCTSRDSFHQSEDFLVSMQRIATFTGSYWYDDEGSKLCIHPRYGPWHAFRAVIIITNVKGRHSLQVDTAGSQAIEKIPSPLQCPVTQQEINDAKILVSFAMKSISSSTKQSNDTGNESLDDEFLSQLNNETINRLNENQKLVSANKINQRQLIWINVRDCFSLGRDRYRYCSEQLCYHYNKDPKIILEAIKHESSTE